MVTGGGHSKAPMKLTLERIERKLHRCRFAAPECNVDEVARVDPNRPQSLSARASLHAGPRAEVAREASSPHPKPPALTHGYAIRRGPKKSSDAFADPDAEECLCDMTFVSAAVSQS